MKALKYICSNQTLSVFVGGKLHQIPAQHSGFKHLSEYLTTNDAHDEATVLGMLDKREMASRLTAGLVKVVGNDIFYNGKPVRSSLTRKIITMLDTGEEGVTAMARFLNNLMENPSDRSKECLFDFLENFDAPLTEDGHFIAWKYVRSDFRDAHSGKFDNSPGKTVEMPREEVNPDPNQTCSAGLHVCASSYLGDYYNRSARVIKVKVNPRDVVAVPNDYGFAKMRVCKYVVLEAVDGHTIDKTNSQQIDNSPSVKASVEAAQAEIPEKLAALPKVANMDEFNNTFVRRLGSDDPDMDDFVVTPDGFTVGIVVGYDTGYEPLEEEWDEEEQEYIEIAEGYDWVEFMVIFQDGSKQRFYAQEFESVGLHVIDVLTEAEDASEDVVVMEEPQEPVFIHEATGQEWKASELAAEVAELGGQRAFHRKYGVPRSTLQGWLAQV